jgi:MarR family transcriptional regulator for hemolysin
MSQPHLGFLLADVARLLRKRFEQNAKQLGLTRSQWQLLVHLSRMEGVTQSVLAEVLEVEPVTLVPILDKLQSQGMVERRAHPTDRRMWLLHLKDKARALLDDIHRIGDATRAEALKDVSEADQRRLMTSLSQMKANLLDACRSNDKEKERRHG